MSGLANIGARNVACVALDTLTTCEQHRFPKGGGHSRLYAAINAVEVVVAWHQCSDAGCATQDQRDALVTHLDVLNEVQYRGRLAGTLDSESITARGLDLAVHITLSALDGTPSSAEVVEHVMAECRALVRLSARAAG